MGSCYMVAPLFYAGNRQRFEAQTAVLGAQERLVDTFLVQIWQVVIVVAVG